jgi:basic membrane protein A
LAENANITRPSRPDVLKSARAVSKTGAAVIAIAVIVVAALGIYFVIFPMTTPVPPEPEKLRIAIMLPGSITDFGWNAAMYEAAVRLNASDPGVSIVIAEGVGQSGPAVDSTMRDFARRNFNIIVPWTLGHQEAVLKIAPDFPETYFIGVNFWQFNDLRNFGSAVDNFYEAYYLEGMLAGAMTKSNTVCWINGQEFPLNNAIVNAYYLGAKRTNPDVDFRWAYAGVWDDVNKGNEIARGLIAAGCDVLATRGDGVTLGAIRAALDEDILVFGDVFDQYTLAPDNMITSSIYNNTFFLEQVVKLYRADKLFGAKPYNFEYSVGNSGHSLAPYHGFAAKIPEDVKAEVVQVIADIKAGTFKVPKITEPLKLP